MLLSGGLDSSTVMAEAKASGFDVYALTVLYGQRHVVERDAARRVAIAMGATRHVEQVIDLRAFGGSALTDDGMDVPKDRPADVMAEGIPITYVPARNTVFLSLALAWAETLGAFDIFVGVNCVDYSGYPDCRPEYLKAFEAMANLATKAGVEGLGSFRVHAPLLMMTKEQIITRGARTGRRLRPDAQLLRPVARRPGVRPMRLMLATSGRVRQARIGRPGAVRRARRSVVRPVECGLAGGDLAFVEVVLVATADEVDLEGLVPDDRLAAVGRRVVPPPVG